jgi:hypothetical protein
VIRCPAGAGDACYACVTSSLKESAPLPDEGEELDYGAIGTDGTIHGAPGLGLDVRLIALLHAKVCLLELLGEPMAGPGGAGGDDPQVARNVLLFGTAPVQGLFPRRFASALLHLSRQAGCLVCSQPRDRSLV